MSDSERPRSEEPSGTVTPERFHDTDRAYRIYKRSGLIIESAPGKPTVCILPNDARVEMEPGEPYKAFLERCEELAGGRPKSRI